MMNSTEQVADFLGHQINCVPDAYGTPHVPLKSLCEILGIDDKRQRREVKDSGVYDWKMLSVKGADGRHRQTLCLPVAAVCDWASTIDPDTVRPEVREALEGYLEEADEVSGGPENKGTPADSEMAENTPEKTRKEQAYNCLGNLSWMIDAFMVWVEEMIDMGGDYAPGPEIRKASKEQLEDYVRRTRCNIRLMQAAVDTARHYQKLGKAIDEEGLAELHDEAWSLYKSLEEMISELGDGNFDLVALDHPALKYLAGPAFEAMSYTSFKIDRDFHETIIPRNEG